MIKIGDRLVTLSQFKARPPSQAPQAKKGRKGKKRRGCPVQCGRTRPPAHEKPCVIRRSGRPFCKFGVNGDAEVLPGQTLGGEQFIYALLDPRDATVRYVGRTIAPVARLAEHINSVGGSKLVHAWVHELKGLGLVPRMVVIDRASHDEWERAEQYWIAFYDNRGSLLNVEVGGRGYLYPRKRSRRMRR